MKRFLIFLLGLVAGVASVAFMKGFERGKRPGSVMLILAVVLALLWIVGRKG